MEETKCLVLYHVIETAWESLTWVVNLDFICSFKNNSLEAYVTNMCVPAALRRMLRLWSSLIKRAKESMEEIE